MDSLIAETEANLARGYALVPEVDVVPRLTFCTGYYGHHRYYGGVNFCTGDYLVERDVPQAIDPVAERRKLSTLRARRRALEAPTQQLLATCATET